MVTNQEDNRRGDREYDCHDEELLQGQHDLLQIMRLHILTAW